MELTIIISYAVIILIVHNAVSFFTMDRTPILPKIIKPIIPFKAINIYPVGKIILRSSSILTLIPFTTMTSPKGDKFDIYGFGSLAVNDIDNRIIKH